MRRTLVIFSQVYVPDPAAMSEHLAHVATEMVRRGWRVIVFTSARGYADASLKFPSRETIDGVEVRRLPLSSFGKRSMLLRAAAGMSFMLQCALRGVFVRNLGALLVTTAPLAAYAALVVSVVRRVPLKSWVLDINPDQLIALGWMRADGIPARVLEWLNGLVLRRAADVIVLDHFMAARRSAKVEGPLAVHIVPPWPLEEQLEPVDQATNPFRAEHGLEDRFVFLYSGNHGLTTPVSTLVDAAIELQDRDRPFFLFIGGGFGKADVEKAVATHGGRNIRSLPHQPLERIKYSLTAADVHVVTMADEVVGIIPPSQISVAMAVGRTALAIAARTRPPGS